MKKIFIIFLFFNTMLLFLSGLNINTAAFLNFKNNNYKIDVNAIDKINSKIQNTYTDEKPSGKNYYNGNYENFTYSTNKFVETNYSMPIFFSNLTKNRTYNKFGICTFVSLASVLNYYDTFFNDLIVPEKYEKNESSTNFQDSTLESPGIFNNSNKIEKLETLDDYFDYVNESYEYDFTSKLIKLLSVAKNSKLTTSLTSKDMKKLVDYYFNVYLENKIYKPKFTSITKKNYENYKDKDTQFLKYTRDIIKTKNPVIMYIKYGHNKETDKPYGHSIVCYDYDNKGNIYANFGWGKKYNRTNLNQFLKDKKGWIINAMSISFKDCKRKRSNNYIINNKGYCGSNISDNVFIKYQLLNDNPPCFQWMLDKDSKDYKSQKFELKFYSNNELLSEKIINNYNAYTFSYNFWEKVKNNIKYLKVYFRRLDNSFYEDDYTTTTFKMNYNNPNPLYLYTSDFEESFEDEVGEYTIDKEFYDHRMKTLCLNKKEDYISLAPRDGFDFAEICFKNSISIYYFTMKAKIDFRGYGKKDIEIGIFSYDPENDKDDVLLYSLYQSDLLTKNFEDYIIVFNEPLFNFKIKYKVYDSSFDEYFTFDMKEIIFYE